MHGAPDPEERRHRRRVAVVEEGSGVIARGVQSGVGWGSPVAVGGMMLEAVGGAQLVERRVEPAQ